MQLYGSAGWFPRKNDERTGYPTQKPLALLKRIIEASSNPGDVVLDPFCGSGTALVAAQALGRQWIGIDSNRDACTIAAGRLSTMFETRNRAGGVSLWTSMVGCPLRRPALPSRHLYQPPAVVYSVYMPSDAIYPSKVQIAILKRVPRAARLNGLTPRMATLEALRMWLLKYGDDECKAETRREIDLDLERTARD